MNTGTNTNRPPLKDPQDTWLNGIIAGITAPIIIYILIQGISAMLASLIEPFDGFSTRLMYIIAIVGNIIPLQIFNRQERGYAMYGVIAVTLVLTFALIFEFSSYFYEPR